MREIKFRVYDAFLKEMNGPKNLSVSVKNGQVESVSFTLRSGAIRSTWTSYNQDGEGLDADRYRLMQFTGLKDKNDVEIYEGDIIAMHNANGGLYDPKMIVRWSEDRAALSYESIEVINKGQVISEHTFFSTGLPTDWSVTVRGNIHENPELLSATHAPQTENKPSGSSESVSVEQV